MQPICSPNRHDAGIACTADQIKALLQPHSDTLPSLCCHLRQRRSSPPENHRHRIVTNEPSKYARQAETGQLCDARQSVLVQLGGVTFIGIIINSCSQHPKAPQAWGSYELIPAILPGVGYVG